jgi:hypothetical protein
LLVPGVLFHMQGDAGRGAVLGSSGGGGASSSEDLDGSESGSEQVSGDGDEFGSGSSSSGGSDAEEADGEGGVDAAYMGMVQRRQPAAGAAANNKQRVGGAEALALQLLQQRHGR